MSDREEYDVVVLGSGAAGKLLAWTLASQGRRTAVVERRYVGGSCPNIACLPSKNVIHGAKVADYFRRGAEFGIANGDWKVDMPAVRDHKRRMVDGLVRMPRGGVLHPLVGVDRPALPPKHDRQPSIAVGRPPRGQPCERTPQPALVGGRGGVW